MGTTAFIDFVGPCPMIANKPPTSTV